MYTQPQSAKSAADKATTDRKPVTVATLARMKQQGEKFAALTAYDASFAALLDHNGVEVVLVGDSLGMVIQGHPTTLPVTVDDMLYHGRAVARGLSRALLMLDMPFMSYQVSVEEAVRNAGRFLKEKNPKIRSIGIDPVGSLLADYHRTKQKVEVSKYLIEGIGTDIIERVTKPVVWSAPR